VTTWLVIWPTVTRLPDGSMSAATPYEDEQKARLAAAKGGGTLVRLPIGEPSERKTA
jgi:hypothetical protein